MKVGDRVGLKDLLGEQKPFDKKNAIVQELLPDNRFVVDSVDPDGKGLNVGLSNLTKPYPEVTFTTYSSIYVMLISNVNLRITFSL